MTGLDCRQFVELVTDFLDGSLDDDTELRVVDHLPCCEGCARYLDQIQRTVRALGDLRAPT